MTGDTVVVTGAAGFIGRWVVGELLECGYAVRGLDDCSSGSRDNVAEFSEDGRFELLVGDVRTPTDVGRLFSTDDPIAACIHLAARIDVHESLENPQSHFETNVVGTQNILDACLETDTPLSLVGTCMVYDVASTTEGIDETHSTRPASPYAGSKLAGENMAESYHRGLDLPITILRPFNTYGPFQRAGSEGGVVSIFTRRDLAGEPLEIYGDGTQTRDLTFVTDTARFIVDATFAEEAYGEVINAGTGSDVSIRELAELIATEGTEIVRVEHHHPQSEISTLRCDPTKASEMLGWEPEVSLEAGVERVRDWMVERQEG